MRTISTAIVGLAVSIGLAGSVEAQSARSDIEAALVTFTKAFNAKDAAGVAAHYTEDAAILPPDSRRVDGRDKIQQFWQGAIDGGGSDLALEAVEVSESGNFAFEVGKFSLKAPGKDDNPVDQAGKYIVISKKGTDGAWQLYRDIWNADPATQQ
ncbi:YybH family protein [Sinorhizobium fredii]|uniref:YybH family protein n=1 Tax=Rhizobium fredii TaxID=380 RepID=UPI000680BBE9|nr:DUF4440 domain-containing protein [Sinorhizobium fredii]AWM27564.1 hypothetical protein AOX55_00004785 [Sinorhizobium fredii CCBAU 25509]